MPANLNGARVLLTGASGGIGNAIARALHGHGAHVLATGRRQDALDELARELGDRVEPLVADLANADDVRALIEHAGHVDVFVSNAALPGSGKLDSFAPEEIDRALDVNLRAPMQITRALLPAMVAQGHGQVVLVSSLAGKVAAAYSSVYSSTKFGLRGFGLSLNDELNGTGVGATVISPGFIRDAGMFADSNVELPAGAGTRTPSDVANAVVAAAERGRGEIDVAPVAFRAGGRLYGLAPEFFAAVQRRIGSHRVGAAIGEGQRDKR